VVAFIGISYVVIQLYLYLLAAPPPREALLIPMLTVCSHGYSVLNFYRVIPLESLFKLVVVLASQIH
jgi:hypothetical protein